MERNSPSQRRCLPVTDAGNNPNAVGIAKRDATFDADTDADPNTDPNADADANANPESNSNTLANATLTGG